MVPLPSDKTTGPSEWLDKNTQWVWVNYDQEVGGGSELIGYALVYALKMCPGCIGNFLEKSDELLN